MRGIIMTLYENLYYQLGEYPKFYRFEGINSFNHFSFTTGSILENVNNYIYFSENIRHHFYYVSKRLKQLIDNEILSDVDYKITKKTIHNRDKFQEIINKIETSSFNDIQLSIECLVSPLMKMLIKNNYVYNSKKEHGDLRIERVDKSNRNGGFGFYGEWLELVHFFTYIFAYQKITKEDLITYIYGFRDKSINSNLKINPVSFLANPINRIKVVNDSLKDDFSKYNLMNIIERIIEKELYFTGSYLDVSKNVAIKKIMQAYTLEREYILTSLNENYERKLKL